MYSSLLRLFRPPPDRSLGALYVIGGVKPLRAPETDPVVKLPPSLICYPSKILPQRHIRARHTPYANQHTGCVLDSFL